MKSKAQERKRKRERREEKSALGVLAFEQLIQPLTTEQFLSSCWGRRPFATTLAPAVMERLLAGFHDGDVVRVLSQCRRVDNSSYSADEVDEMQRELDSQRKTLNQPYCFCPGALELSGAFVDSCGHLANDIEVGVYFSEVGGDAASWHFDNNHNFTIQLTGQKDWYHLPGPVADLTAGMFDAPRNGADIQRAPPPAAGLAHCSCFNLGPGSLIYLPPGHWHSVAPVEGGSFSVRPLGDRWEIEGRLKGDGMETEGRSKGDRRGTQEIGQEPAETAGS